MVRKRWISMTVRLPSSRSPRASCRTALLADEVEDVVLDLEAIPISRNASSNRPRIAGSVTPAQTAPIRQG